MNKTLTITAIALVAVVMGFSVVAPAMAAVGGNTLKYLESGCESGAECQVFKVGTNERCILTGDESNYLKDMKYEVIEKSGMAGCSDPDGFDSTVLRWGAPMIAQPPCDSSPCERLYGVYVDPDGSGCEPSNHVHDFPQTWIEDRGISSCGLMVGPGA